MYYTVCNMLSKDEILAKNITYHLSMEGTSSTKSLIICNAVTTNYICNNI